MKLIKVNLGRYINPGNYGYYELIRKSDKTGMLLVFGTNEEDSMTVATITHETLNIKEIEQKALELYDRLIDFLAGDESGVFDLRAEYERVFGERD